MGNIKKMMFGRCLLGCSARLESWILLGRHEENDVWEVSSGVGRAAGTMDFLWGALRNLYLGGVVWG